MAVGDSGLQALTLQQMLDRFAELAAAEVILGNYKFDGALEIKERASSAAFTAGYGQIFIKNESPAELWFADDVGTESQVQLGAGGAGDVTKVGTPVDNQIGVWTGDGTIEGDANFTWTGSALIVAGAGAQIHPLDGTEALPAYSWSSDPTTGFHRSGGGAIVYTALGSNSWQLTANVMGATAAGGPVFRNEAASATNPTVLPDSADADSGLGQNSLDELSLIAGSIEGIRLTELNSGVVQAPAADLTITAFATGGLTNAVALKQSYNRISVCATTGDSVKLPAVFAAKSIVYVKNDGANSADIFPSLGDNLGEGVDTALAVPAGETKSFLATAANSTWTQLLPISAQADPLLLADGSAGAPSYSYTDDPDTGFFRVGSGLVGFSDDGTEQWRIGGTIFQGVGVGGGAGEGPLLFNRVPSTSLVSVCPRRDDTNTGMGSGAIGELSLIAAGFEGLRVERVGGVTQVLSIAGAVANPAYSFTGDKDTGFAGLALDQLSLIAGGQEGLRFTELNSGVVQAPAADIAITALAGGAQGGAGIMKQSYNRITTVATTADSVTLPAVFAVNSIITIQNDGANSANVFPASGDDLGAGADTAVALDAGSGITYIAVGANSTWAPFGVSGGGSGDVTKVGTPADNEIGVWTGDGTIEGDSSFTWDGSQFLLPQDNDAVTPTLAFGDGNSGFYELADNKIAVAILGAPHWLWETITEGVVFRGSNTDSPSLLDVNSTATVPVFCFQSDVDTGIGRAETNQLSMIAGGIEGLRIWGVSGGTLWSPSSSLTITAFATGGESGAFAIINPYNVITTAASAGDSVKLPAVFFVNTIIHIKNDGANAVDVFPASGDDLGQGTDSAESLAAGRNTAYIATTANATWTNMTPLLVATADPLRLGDGTASAPAFAFTSDANSGLYRIGADEMALSVGALEAFRLKETGSVVTAFLAGDLTVTGDVIANDAAGYSLLDVAASVTVPTLIPNKIDPNTGIGRGSSDELALIAGGLACMRVEEIASARALAFYVTDPIILQTGVAVSSAGIHAALVNLGLITA